MTEEQVKEYLKKRGCPQAVWQGGRDHLVARWKNFVAEVEQGYCADCLIEEYCNDLDTRELVDDIGCGDEVKELDERFATMLTATHIKPWRTDRKSEYAFWNYQYPRNATDLFYEGVKRYILGQSGSAT